MSQGFDNQEMDLIGNQEEEVLQPVPTPPSTPQGAPGPSQESLQQAPGRSGRHIPRIGGPENSRVRRELFPEAAQDTDTGIATIEQGNQGNDEQLEQEQRRKLRILQWIIRK